MQHQVGTVLRRHRLRVQGEASRFRASLEHLGDTEMSVTRLSYGAAVIVEPVPEPGFWVLSLPMRGQVSVRADSGKVDSTPGVASFIPSDGNVAGHWHSSARQTVLRIRQELLWDACAGIDLGRHSDPDSFLRHHSPVLPIATQPGLLAGTLQTLASLDFEAYLAQPEKSCASQWSAMARLIACAVVTSRAAQTSSPSERAHHPKRSGHIQALMREMVYAEQLLTVSTLAARARISVRSLQLMFQQQGGSTALQAIREVKLQRARELIDAGASSVSDTAMACGFQHMGRFASLYAARFGSLPGVQARRSARESF